MWQDTGITGGVRTYGAWLWDNQLKIGLATEIDEADALGPFYTIRTVILTVLGITALLALGSLAVYGGDRRTRRPCVTEIQ